MGGLVMKKNNLKRPIINKFIIGTLSAGLLAGGAAPETDAIFVREVYAANCHSGTNRCAGTNCCSRAFRYAGAFCYTETDRHSGS